MEVKSYWIVYLGSGVVVIEVFVVGEVLEWDFVFVGYLEDGGELVCWVGVGLGFKISDGRDGDGGGWKG